MNPLDNLTVCITSFRRSALLERTLKSVQAAGIRRLVIAAVEPDAETLAIIRSWEAAWETGADDWLSFDVVTVQDDIGCNDTWQLAAYHSRTSRIIILHDDDLLNSDFGPAYCETISPALDKGSTFATWRADLVFLDGHHEKTEFWSGPTRLSASAELLRVVNRRNTLSLSPIISVLDRQTVIHACKEASQTLSHRESYLHPGMLLGTELVVYIRHIQKFSKWLYVDKVLSHYGSHEGSGTIKAQSSGDLSPLCKGYDRARTQAMGTKPVMKPKLIFVYYVNQTSDPDEIERNRIARASWDYHFSQGEFIEMPVCKEDLSRTSFSLGDSRAMPYVRDLFDWGFAHAMPEDVVVYCNRDIGLTANAGALLLAGVARGRGITCCQRRRIDPKPGRMYKDLVNCATDGGFDVFSVTREWWKNFRDKMPDMLIGREAWDTCLRTLAEEWADGIPRLSRVSGSPAQWDKSKAYTDHVCWHKNHLSNWITERNTSAGQLHNRRLGKIFFAARNNQDLVRALT